MSKSKSKPKALHRPLEMSGELVAGLDEDDLKQLMLELMQAQSYLCDADRSKIVVATESKAQDGGSDGYSPKPKKVDAWLGESETCWQFKAKTAGSPGKLKPEVLKLIPQQTLKNGGRFAVVTSSSKSGDGGEKRRLEVLVEVAKASSLPTDKIEVFGSERIANWCSEHPAIVARWIQLNGSWTLGEWGKIEQHQSSWQSNQEIETMLHAYRQDLGLNGSIFHLHIQGFPGVGKTRLALELCKGADWSDFVIYIAQAVDVNLSEVINSIVNAPSARVVLVVDEVQSHQLESLRENVGRAQGRIRLVSIGHCASPDPVRIPSIVVKPTLAPQMKKIVSGWHAAMPKEHVQFVVDFAGGYVRLAKLASDAVAKDPNVDVRILHSRDHIREFMNKLLGNANRRALHVVAILTSVGWDREFEEEGKLIAEHLKLDWNQVKVEVRQFNNQFGVAPQGGRFRYISPTPLGIHLAIEAWELFPRELKALEKLLPTERSKNAYYERLKLIASSPQARELARTELAFFFQIDNFFDTNEVRRWASFAVADPTLAISKLLSVLVASSVESRRKIQNDARRNLVFALVDLCWDSTIFHDAAVSLALLGEAENETWGNNASGEFTARYQLFLGGTACPFMKRIEVLDELVQTGRLDVLRLVLQAITKISLHSESRTSSETSYSKVREPEWHPSNPTETADCILAMIIRFQTIIELEIPELENNLIETARELAPLIKVKKFRESVSEAVRHLKKVYPNSREVLRNIVFNLIKDEIKIFKDLPNADVAEIELLHTFLTENTLAARLQQHVGSTTWEEEEQVDLTGLASDLIQSESTLRDHWPWITSGEAGDALRLGHAIARIDQSENFLSWLPSLLTIGQDFAVVVGYLEEVRKRHDVEWYQEWLKGQITSDEWNVSLVFDLIWRLGVSDTNLDCLRARFSSSDISPRLVGRLAYGRWFIEAAPSPLYAFLSVLTISGHSETAVAILDHRLRKNLDELEFWKDLAIQLISQPKLIRATQMVSHYWSNLATLFSKSFAAEIAFAILREHSDRKKGSWFIEYNNANRILNLCVDLDPKGVWRALVPFLDSQHYPTFYIGFPGSILEKLPSQDVSMWLKENPNERAYALAKHLSVSLDSDETLAAKILGEFADDPDISKLLFSVYVSGSWWGPASEHYLKLAEYLEQTVPRTKLPKLKRWANEMAASLRRMAEQEQLVEEEERNP